MLKPIILKNGLTILRIPKASSNIFMNGFIVPTGSVIENGNFPPGISHLVERLFWCGTDKHPSSRSLNLTLENFGGQFNSQTSKELMQFYLTVPSSNQFKAVSMMAEIIQRSFFDIRDIEREKKNVIESLKDFDRNIEKEALEGAVSTLYPDHNLGLPVNGSLDTITLINQEAVFEYLTHQFRPDKCYLVLAGNFDSKSAVELAEQEWSIWNPKPKRFLENMEFNWESMNDLPKITYRQRGMSSTLLVMDFLLDMGLLHSQLKEAKTSEEKIVIDEKQILNDVLQNLARIMVLNSVLGQGLSSRLWNKCVEEEGLFGKLYSQVIKHKDTGYLQIFGQTDNIQFSFALESVLSVLESLKKTTVSINELAKAKECLKGKLILDQEDLLTQVSWQIENLIGTELNFELSDLITYINKVEAAELRALSCDLFVSERMVLSTLGTTKETRLVDKLIKKYLG